ncbi:MAG: hypothetical protein ACT4P9_10705 [Betaproteobacteria bacterium]
METRLTLRPGQNGTRKLVERFGKRLVCVRYRYDEENARRYTTVELVVAEAEWKPRSRKPRASRSPEDMVYVRIGYAEAALRVKMKALGAIWRPKLKLWELPWGVVRGLELEGRVVEESLNENGG